MMSLKKPSKGTTPQAFKLVFPEKKWGPKQKHKKNKLKIIKFFKLTSRM
jgi:hypothetical protein